MKCFALKLDTLGARRTNRSDNSNLAGGGASVSDYRNGATRDRRDGAIVSGGFRLDPGAD